MRKFQRLLNMYFIFLLSISLCCSCEEEFHIDSVEISNAIAFDGVITNEPPPYFFCLTHIAPLGEYEDGVVDAQIVITDHTVGIVDTLELLVPIRDGLGTEIPYYNYHSQKKEVIYLHNFKPNVDGIYVTTKIYGIENHHYTLDVLYRGKHHTADETMIPKTLITTMTVKEVDLGVKGKSFAPCISFVNRPGEENYYLLKVYPFSTKSNRISSPYRFYYATNYWAYSILSDEYLEEKVDDFVVGEGEQRFGLPGASYPSSSDSLFVCMQSISKSCYEGYDDMIKQLRTDGGAYTPRPVGIRSNISGGVFGLFRVSSISERYVLLKNRK